MSRSVLDNRPKRLVPFQPSQSTVAERRAPCASKPSTTEAYHGASDSKDRFDWTKTYWTVG
ncbi:MAG: hypothetical protein KKB37_14880 [Alphaproteobacteria bacterium]|nr:hypothetical protein [Alphaproteobacteria bacterium]